MRHIKIKGVKFSWKHSRGDNNAYDRIVGDVRGQNRYDVDIYNYDEDIYQSLTIISTSGVIYKMSEIKLYPLNLIRKDKINKILGNG